MTQIKPTMGAAAASVASLIERLGLTVPHAALFMGVPVPTLRHWLDGSREPGAVVARLVDVLSTLEVMAPNILMALIPDAPTPKQKGRPKRPVIPG